MASSFMIMALLKDGVAKEFIFGDIDMALVDWNACFNLPVEKMGAEEERNILVHQLKCLEGKGVTGRGGFNVMGEGNFDDIDEEEGGKEGDSFIVIIAVWKEM